VGALVAQLPAGQGERHQALRIYRHRAVRLFNGFPCDGRITGLEKESVPRRRMKTSLMQIEEGCDGLRLIRNVSRADSASRNFWRFSTNLSRLHRSQLQTSLR
jgi:hypothetical protein